MYRYLVFLLLFSCFCLTSAQDKIDTLKIYDRADNLLYYLTYDYGTDSVLIGQSLYDRTGYFLKSIKVDASNKRSFRDDNGDLYHYSLSRKEGARNYFDLYDRFNKPLEQRVYQGYSDQGATAGLVEFFNLSGGLTHKMEYVYNGSRIDRINVLGNTGVMSHHVDVHYIGGPIRVEEGDASHLGDGLLAMQAGFNGISASFVLKSVGRVRIDAYDIRGRHAGVLIDRVFPAGPSRLFFNTSGLAFLRSAGVYLVRMDLKGRLYYTKMIVLD